MKSVMWKRFFRINIVLAISVLFAYGLFVSELNIQAKDITTESTAQASVGDIKISDKTVESDKTSKAVLKKLRKIKKETPKVNVKQRYEKNVKITWKKVKNAKFYLVYRSDGDKTVFKKVKKTKKKYYIDKTAAKRSTYKYRVVAVAKAYGKSFESKSGKTGKIYVRPENPKVVISGECFVEGIDIYAKSYLPNNYHLVYKVGVSTYGMLNSNYFSYNGMTITGIERVACYHPDRVFFLIGMNEAINWNTTSTINNYKKMIQLLKKVNPNVEVVLLALPPVGVDHVAGFASNSYINHYNKAYKNLAKQTKNVYYYSDYRKLITDSNGYLMSYANGGDGGHWSAQGTINVLNDIKKYSDKLTKGK